MRAALHRIFKWGTVVVLVLLAAGATAFWAVMLGSGLHARKGVNPGERVVITPECAWPYDVDHRDAEAVCRLFYDMTPEQRAEAVKARRR